MAWGLFFVLIGVSWATSSYYAIDMVPYVSLGTGLILIGFNAARAGMGMGMNKFSLFIGIIAFAFGIAALLEWRLELIPTIIVLIGLFIIAEAARSLAKK